MVMANGKEMTTVQFGGIPMESLIGGPLKAVCEAQMKQAEWTAEFIRNRSEKCRGKEGRVGFRQESTR